MKIEKYTGQGSSMAVMEVGKSRAKWMASHLDPRVRSSVITMCFDVSGELTSYVECSLDEGGNELWGGGIERCGEKWKSFAIDAKHHSGQHRRGIGESMHPERCYRKGV